MTSVVRVVPVVATAVAIASAACAGELADPGRFADCPPGYVEQLFQSRCGECHDATEPDAFLDLTSPGVDQRVFGIASMSTCEGRMLVEPGGGDHLLLEKLEASPSCGTRMPLGLPALSPIEIECVRRWVDDLAEAP